MPWYQFMLLMGLALLKRACPSTQSRTCPRFSSILDRFPSATAWVQKPAACVISVVDAGEGEGRARPVIATAADKVLRGLFMGYVFG